VVTINDGENIIIKASYEDMSELSAIVNTFCRQCPDDDRAKEISHLLSNPIFKEGN